jgi:N-acetylmuramoyl-L-alanine amidase
MQRLLLFLFLITTSYFALGQSSNKKAIAKDGDGIHSMLKRNHLDTPSMYQAFIKLNSNKLGKNNYLIKGKEYILPTPQSKKTRSFDIFGNKYKNVTIKDQKLKGAIFYIVSGHGGPDPGAQSHRNGHTLSEDEYAYDISLRLVRELISHSATAYMITRDANDGIRDNSYLPNDKEETIWKDHKIPRNTNKKLRQRARAVNKLYKQNAGRYQRMIVIHIDSRYKEQRVDIYGYHSSKSKSGKTFTNNLIQSVKRKYKEAQPNREFSGLSKSRDQLYMIKYTSPTTSFLELGNIQNPADQVRFIKASNRQAIAEWLSLGCIVDYQQSKK